MSKSLKQVIKELPAEERALVKARTAELIAEEMTLREIRRKMNLTQEEVAARLEKGQESISRLERQTDLMLSTLRNLVEALGGTLQIIAEFPGRPPVTLTGLGEPVTKKKSATRKRSRGRRGGGESRASA